MKRLFRTSLLTAIAATGIMLTACTDSEIFTDDLKTKVAQESPENAISFGTYMGRTTRSGAPGTINTDTLKGYTYNGSLKWVEANAKKFGFGVFAYYTGAKTYNAFQDNTYGTTSGADQAANFMFNQQVWWNENTVTNDFITKWYYTPIKYWPNEIANVNDGDDDQEDDTDQNPAFTPGTDQRGKLSFFAYAPYVDLPIYGTDKGIVAINGQTALANANAEVGDPTVTYKLATDAKDNVDLLWGTYGHTSTNINGGVANAGVAFNATGNEYEKAILENANSGYRLNADLTKQKTTGTVDFAFKHALAKIGGGETTITGATIPGGLMVVLDIDDQKGAEQGGTREKWGAGNDYIRTIVTISDIKISNNLSGTGSAASSITINGKTFEGTVNNQGVLNLATGQWTGLDGAASNPLIQQTIGTKEESSSDDDNGLYSAVLKENLREYKYYKDAGDNTTYIKTYKDASKLADYFGITSELAAGWGVTETPQNVFEDPDTPPLLFIPGTKPVLRFDITYVVRTYDANLSSSYTEVPQTVSKIVEFVNAVELNKQYNILIHLGLTSVKFTASVSNWVVDGDTDEDGEIETGEEIKVTDVYLPRNVGAATASVKGSELPGSKTIEVGASTTQVTVNFTELTGGAFRTTATSLLTGDKLTPLGDGTVAGEAQAVTLTMEPNTGTSTLNHEFTFRWQSMDYTVTVKQLPSPIKVVATPSSVAASSTQFQPTYTATNAFGAVDLSGATYEKVGTADWAVVVASNGKIEAAATNSGTEDQLIDVKVTIGEVSDVVTLTRLKP